MYTGAFNKSIIVIERKLSSIFTLLSIGGQHLATLHNLLHAVL